MRSIRGNGIQYHQRQGKSGRRDQKESAAGDSGDELHAEHRSAESEDEEYPEYRGHCGGYDSLCPAGYHRRHHGVLRKRRLSDPAGEFTSV